MYVHALARAKRDHQHTAGAHPVTPFTIVLSDSFLSSRSLSIFALTALISNTSLYARKSSDT
jgi:hypothetical protein